MEYNMEYNMEEYEEYSHLPKENLIKIILNLKNIQKNHMELVEIYKKEVKEVKKENERYLQENKWQTEHIIKLQDKIERLKK